MRVKKYLIASHSALLKQLTVLINKFVSELGTGTNLDSFYSKLTFPDGEVKFDNVDEYKEYHSLYLEKNVWLSFNSVTINTSRNDRSMEINISSYNDEDNEGITYISIEAESRNINDIDRILLTFSTEFNKEYVQYLPEEEQQMERGRKIAKVIEILSNFELFHHRRAYLIDNEKALQNFVFPILKSHFLDIEDEFTLTKFGASEYIPDFGIPSGGLLIECKYLTSQKGHLKKLQKEINDDVVGYLTKSESYNQMIIFVYNSENVPVENKFVDDLEKISGVARVIITPGVNIENKNG